MLLIVAIPGSVPDIGKMPLLLDSWLAEGIVI